MAEAVPVDVDGQRIYVWMEEVDSGEEREIAFRKPSLEQALDGLTGLVRAMGGRLRDTGASRVNVEFACEFGLESGSFVAVIGKATGKSTFKVSVEWTQETA